MEGDAPVGIVTRKDLASRLVQAKPEWRRRPIDHIPVRLTMTAEPITIHPGATVQQAAVLMRDNDISGLLVIDDGLEGIITKTDLVKYFSGSGSDEKVREIMQKNYSTVHIQHSVNHVMETMDENGIDRVVVVDGEKPVGIVNRDGLAFVNLPASGKRTERTVTEDGRVMIAREQALLTAGDVMYSPPVMTTPDGKATEASTLLLENNLYEILVVEEGELKGVFTMRNVVEYLAG
jgi:CBS domain-containing protein